MKNKHTKNLYNVLFIDSKNNYIFKLSPNYNLVKFFNFLVLFQTTKFISYMILISIFIGMIIFNFKNVAYSQTSIKSENAYDLFNEALLNQNNKNYPIAKKKYEEFLKKFSNHELARRAKFELAIVLKNLNENDKAIKLLLETIQMGNGLRDRNSIESVKALAKIYYDTMRFKQGIELLEPYYQANLDNPDLCVILSKFYIASGRIDEAKLILESSLQRTLNSWVFSELLSIAVQQNKVEELIKFLDENISNINKTSYLEYVTDCYITLNQLDKAIKKLEDSKILDSELSLKQKLADLYYKTGNYNNALDCYKSLINKYNSDNWMYYKAIGNCYIKLGKKEKALEIWRDGLNLGQNTEEAYSNYINILLEHKLYNEVLQTFEEARTKLNNSTIFAEEKASVLEAIGKEYHALAEYFLALSNGTYKTEIFNKLYNKRSANFDFLQLLKSSIKNGNVNYSIRKALVEYYYKEQNTNFLNEIINLANNDDLLLSLLVERLKYCLQGNFNAFSLKLLEEIVKKFANNNLTYDLLYTLFKNYKYLDKEYIIKFIQMSTKLLSQHTLTNSNEIEPAYKVKLMFIIAHILFNEFYKLDDALKLLKQIINVQHLYTEPEIQIETFYLLMKIYTIQNQYKEAQNFLLQATQIAQNLGRQYEPKILFEEAWFLAYTGKFEEALTKLRTIVEKYLNSEYANDAIDLATTITTISNNTTIDACKDYVQVKKCIYTNQLQTAETTLYNLFKLASGTNIIPYLESDLLTLNIYKLIHKPKIEYEDLKNLKSKVYEFITRHPNYWRTVDVFYNFAEIIYFIKSNIFENVAMFYIKNLLTNYDSLDIINQSTNQNSTDTSNNNILSNSNQSTNQNLSINTNTQQPQNLQHNSILHPNPNIALIENDEVNQIFKDFIETFPYDFRVNNVKNWQKIIQK